MAPSQETITIPSWMLKVAGGILGLTVPWMGWVTVQLSIISVKVDTAAETASWRLAEVERRITSNEAELKSLRQHLLLKDSSP